MGDRPPVRGIREHLGQFSVQVLLVAATGLTLGSERAVLSVMGRDVHEVESLLTLASFVASFGFVKALLNLYAGKWGEVHGRKPVLVLGWLTALPLPVVLVYAPGWDWIVLGNALLGVNQALTWSMAVNAKIDLARQDQRGLAVGIDESFGYTGSAVGAWVTGEIAARTGLGPEPFYFMAAVVVLALVVAVVLARETVAFARREGDDDAGADLSLAAVLRRATYGDRTMFAAAQAGHIENYVDTLFWIAVPLYLVSKGVGYAEVGLVAAVHHGAYFLQIGTGELADRIGRRQPVIAGMFVAGGGALGMTFVEGVVPWTLMSATSGVGMALLYPNLMTVAGDACHPSWRAAGMGVYRMWRDAGYGVGAIVVGILMDLAAVETAFEVTAALMFLSGIVVYAWMEETHPRFGTHEPPVDEAVQGVGGSDD